MNKKKYFVLFFSLLVTIVFLSEKNLLSGNPGKIIFSNKQIKQGLENKVPLKTEFISSEVIWARAFFPKRLGNLKRGESLNIDIWVDGRFARRVKIAKPNPKWTQMQIYVHNTGDDDINSTVYDRISSGKHEVSIHVVYAKFMMKKKVVRSGRVYYEDVFKPVYLSKGKINYIVP